MAMNDWDDTTMGEGWYKGAWDIATNNPPIAHTDTIVYVDMKPVEHVRAFNTEEGWVRCLYLDKNGIGACHPFIDEPVEVTYRGRVTVWVRR